MLDTIWTIICVVVVFGTAGAMIAEAIGARMQNKQDAIRRWEADNPSE